MVIVFEGKIGAGKSSVASRLAEKLGTELFRELVDNNELLENYYADPERYGFQLQISFLNQRFKDIKEAYKSDNNILDRSILADQLFTLTNAQRGSFTWWEYELYCGLLSNMMEEIENLPYKKSPDLLIYLDANLDHTLKNIKKRGRAYEQVEDENGSIIDAEQLGYYKLLSDNYDVWIGKREPLNEGEKSIGVYNSSPVLIIDAEKYDVVNSEDDWNEVYNIIENKLKELGLL